MTKNPLRLSPRLTVVRPYSSSAPECAALRSWVWGDFALLPLRCFVLCPFLHWLPLPSAWICVSLSLGSRGVCSPVGGLLCCCLCSAICLPSSVACTCTWMETCFVTWCASVACSGAFCSVSGRAPAAELLGHRGVGVLAASGALGGCGRCWSRVMRSCVARGVGAREAVGAVGCGRCVLGARATVGAVGCGRCLW